MFLACLMHIFTSSKSESFNFPSHTALAQSRIQIPSKIAFAFSLIYVGTGLIILTPGALDFYQDAASEQQ